MEAAIGIIGLSLQLVDSAIKVKRVIGTYRSASKEIGRLALNVEKVEAVAGAIRKSFEGDASNRRCSELIHTWGLIVLREIQSNLGEIQDIIDKLERRASKTRTLYTVGFSFLEKKDEISRLSSALDRNLNDLQHMMTAEIFSRCNVFEQLIPAPTSIEIAPLKPQLPLSKAHSNSMALNGYGTTTNVEKSDSRQMQILGFQGGMQSTRVTKKMQRRGLDDFVNVKESKTYTFGIRGYSYRVELGWTFDTLTPISYALNLQHILRKDVDEELYGRTDDMINTGDLGGLQRMFTKREISPTTFMGRLTLYELAILYCQPRICHFLALQNLRQCLAEDISRPDGGTFRTKGFHLLASDVFDIDNVLLLTGASPALRMQWLFTFNLQEDLFFPHYARIRASDLGVVEREEFLNTSWSTGVCTFVKKVQAYCWLPYFRSLDGWVNIFTALAKEGFNAQQTCFSTDNPNIDAPRERGSPLVMILLKSTCHREVEGVISHWLTVLQAAGIDVEAYLSWERLRCEEKWAKSEYLHQTCDGKWPQVLGSRVIGGFKVPMWYRWVDPSKPAYEARHEFRNWGSLTRNPCADGDWLQKRIVGNTSQHLLWKTCPGSKHTKRDWPFVYSMARDLPAVWINPSYSSMDEYRTSLSQSLDYAKDLVARRFNRRQMRKLYKSGYLRKEKRAFKLPGAWADSEW